jgi:hypothetical protein
MKQNSNEIEADLFDILMDNGSSQLEEQFLKSKKKLLNAKRGRNELFNVLKVKSKGLDMMILVMQNNKEIAKKQNLFCLESLESLFKLAKNDKTMFAPISKKIKQILALVLKNQICVKNEEKYVEIVKFVTDVMK